MTILSAALIWTEGCDGSADRDLWCPDPKCAAADAGGHIVDLHEFDLPDAHVLVPEMADDHPSVQPTPSGLSPAPAGRPFVPAHRAARTGENASIRRAADKNPDTGLGPLSPPAHVAEPDSRLGLILERRPPS
ncbi:hypothetical protein DDE18_08965 [Nocardioides gansuensis]|uniref:Uncharacterized protein n=1 Tax=Nocardioides gansuensis TaxID=2138300 RepID=A0A2T8FCG7_9ACTN|nr:hypothetical protein [Nocardioides gansuensis]PVG83408.1 hypothetical protein DDE18_08965 [Nocardioides gansuensis]